MKAEINNENKAKFFAIYYDQVVLFQASFVKGDDLKSILNNKEQDRYGESAYLRLKPLSSISDEDALTVAKFMGFDGWSSAMARAMILKLFLINSNDPIKDDLIIKQMLFKFSDISSTVDLFRSIGYAYEWMGLSVDEMIEAGWIKLIDK